MHWNGLIFRRSHTIIHSTHNDRLQTLVWTLRQLCVHLGGHALACTMSRQECCSELADQEIRIAKEQDLRQPRVSSLSRFKIFFFFSQLPSCSNCQCSEVRLERQRHPGRRRGPLTVSWDPLRVGKAAGEHRQMQEVSKPGYRPVQFIYFKRGCSSFNKPW